MGFADSAITENLKRCVAFPTTLFNETCRLCYEKGLLFSFHKSHIVVICVFNSLRFGSDTFFLWYVRMWQIEKYFYAV